ncbi:glycosyl hydrolase family 32 [Sphingomonas oleivorans]|uniref:Glycosyl hydrolase family 32 n=1 Tax=Sphingomonas oleivorans TaxID=1735121 RepID=A0A2T5FTQ9_9SPHN|nr:glycoside hydrolase family 32 protein [Sphingomonas oleivorans]PTQ07460.1 glycosyl hydrolase family 32 [Sphingomonas oleivorans]
MTEKIVALYGETHRPQIHFSPAENWINDPTGLVHYNGRYHLFYQHNPSDKIWGNMHWGHAVSTDLIHWEHRPVALRASPEGLGYIFSGSAVVDWNNSSGFQTGDHPPIVAIFTHSSRDNHQVQSLAYSLNGGDVWQMYRGNPVLDNPGIADFRDPKVIWDKARNQWVMVLAAHDMIKFYRSDNLINWEYCSDFGQDVGSHGGVWECPDLFPLDLPDAGGQKWILIVSLNPGAPNGGSGTQYFIGDFDGRSFHCDLPETLWMDYGPDNYAGVTWSDVPEQDGRRILIGWMNNWQYANALPTSPWRGAMTLPRELRLIRTDAGLRLSCAPLAELATLRRGNPITHRNVLIDEAYDLGNGAALGELLDISLQMDWPQQEAHDWSMHFLNGDDEELTLNFDMRSGQLCVDRTKASFRIGDVASFSSEIIAPIEIGGETSIGLRMIKDTSSLEIYLEDGRGLLTLNYFVESRLDRLEMRSGRDGHPIKLKAASINALTGIWD